MTDARDLTKLDRCLTPQERRSLFHTPAKGKRGHAAAPGTGPQGETCGTCANLVRKQMAGTYLKCGLMRSAWTGGGGTDVRAKDPACRAWERASVHASR